MRNRHGFTLVELVVALVLFGLVGTSIYSLLVNNQRLYLSQSERVNANTSARAAVSILPHSIRELSATDLDGSDILAATATGFRFRSLKNVYFACQDGALGTLVLDRATWFGIRALDVTTDSLLIFAENDLATRTDDQWLHANVTSAVVGTACPSSQPSITLLLDLLSGTMSGVLQGAPVRSYQIEQVSAYSDASGDSWLGAQTISKSTGTAGTIQPIVGPLSGAGLALVYYDANGDVTADRARIARMGITVVGQSRSVVRTDTGIGYLTQDLTTDVSLRNNCRFSCP
jgi:prepilin-type N-terminal cleavage/methylation domain-containing protein